MTPRWVLPVGPMFTSILIALALVSCGPDSAKQALLEQLVTTQSTITVGVTPVTLREREIALRTAAALVNDHLKGGQRNAVADTILAISETQTLWSDAIRGALDSGYVDLRSLGGERRFKPTFTALGASAYQEFISKPPHTITVRTVIAPLLNTCAAQLDTAIALLR